MARLTQDKILDMAEKIIYEKGMAKTTLYDIAKNLEVTHAALYKHYRNKEDLFQKLALRWLEVTSHHLLIWESDRGTSQTENLHDWLWELAQTKKNLYLTDQRMFLLYTDYIEHNQELVAEHLNALGEKAEEISGWLNQGQGVITAFVYFHNPYFASRWTAADHQEHFESVWSLMVRDESKGQ